MEFTRLYSTMCQPAATQSTAWSDNQAPCSLMIVSIFKPSRSFADCLLASLGLSG